MSACPDRLLMLNALVDGELDAGHTLDIERHIAGCPGCAAELSGLQTLRETLGAHDLAHTAPPDFRARVLAALDEADRPAPVAQTPGRRRFVERWLAGGGATALAASLAVFAIIGPMAENVPGELVDGHVRSLQAQHLVDVATSDRHTVKPWFNGKIAFAPPVTDLVAQGYPLVGGRLDRIGGHDAAVLVFHRRAHVINLFIWPGQAGAAPRIVRREGYALVEWGRGGLVYWAVSDVDPADLAGFQKAFVEATAS